MNWFKGFALAIGLAAPLPLIAMPVFAATAAPAAGAKVDTTAATAVDNKGSEADKRAKAADCSKQADAKKLHGEARKKFRSACKRG